jgi:PPOX class probable F420-dependent enzyme
MSRRDQIRMTPDEVDAFVATRRTLHVASLNTDGSVHLVPMWFARFDGDLAFWTYAKSQKIVNLRRDPRITVMMESGEVYEELKGVTISGRARIVDDLDEVLRFGELVYERYWGPITDDAVRMGVRAMGAKRVVVVVAADDTVSWDHSKLGGGY